MRFSEKRIFQRAGRSTAWSIEPIHIHLLGNKMKFNFRGHVETIYIRNQIRNNFFRFLQPEKLGKNIHLFFHTAAILLSRCF